MALFFADLVREACLGTGTGDLALGGALPGHRRFADAVPPGARFHYCAAGVTHPGEWETGEGEIGSGDTLVRTPLASSAGPSTGSGPAAAVDFSAGLKTVALVAAAAWFAAQEEGGAAGIADVEGLEAALAAKAALAGAGFTGAVSAPSLAAAGDADVAGAYRVDGVKVVGNRATGWSMPTGAASRAAFDTTGISVSQLAQRVKALIDDLAGHGLIGS